jgi:hypothetical protein
MPNPVRDSAMLRREPGGRKVQSAAERGVLCEEVVVCRLAPSLSQPHHDPLSTVNRHFGSLGHALELLQCVAVPRLSLPKGFRRQPGLEARSLPSRRRRHRCARPRIVQWLALASIHGVALAPVFTLIVAGQRARFLSHIKIRGRHRNKVVSKRGGASQSAVTAHLSGVWNFVSLCADDCSSCQDSRAKG